MSDMDIVGIAEEEDDMLNDRSSVNTQTYSKPVQPQRKRPMPTPPQPSASDSAPSATPRTEDDSLRMYATRKGIPQTTCRYYKRLLIYSSSVQRHAEHRRTRAIAADMFCPCSTVSGLQGARGEQVWDERVVVGGNSCTSPVSPQPTLSPHEHAVNGGGRLRNMTELPQRKMVDITRDKPIKVTIRVVVPVRDHPKDFLNEVQQTDLVFMTLLRHFRQTGSTDKATTGCVASWRGLSQREKRKKVTSASLGTLGKKMQFVDSCFAHTKQISLGVPMSIQELGEVVST
ncbi:hypothetical protein J6590_068849 [Homalodisca vitripennis]|nr:hypothetical protein J6590_068849 [Homalodisca vitripennis]